MLSLLFSSFGLFGLLGTAFWIWMLYECLRTGGAGDRQWVWILIFLNIIGALLYFFIVWLPRNPQFVGKLGIQNRSKLRDQLWQAEAEVKNIGKAHQYIKLGNILYDLGEAERAAEAYQQAIEQEPKNVKALWGAACAARDRQDFAAAKDHLHQLIQIEPEFSYGEASLAYGETLAQAGDLDAAATHLQQHLKSWSNPQGYVILAEIQESQKQFAAACETLETMMIKIKGFVPFQYKKNQHFIRQAERKIQVLRRSS
ncbi:MAG: tetratricopeptide repeat protein [Spirulinaceae cyanobacterium]